MDLMTRDAQPNVDPGPLYTDEIHGGRDEASPTQPNVDAGPILSADVTEGVRGDRGAAQPNVDPGPLYGEPVAKGDVSEPRPAPTEKIDSPE
jgi:hypothetical protein